MSTLDTIERNQERRRRNAVYLSLAAALILILGLVGRSLLGGSDMAEDADRPVEVLSGVMQQTGGSGLAGGGLAVSAAGNPNQGNPGNSGPQGNVGSNPGGSQGNPGGGLPGGNPPGQTPDGTPAQPRTFEISGDVDEIYPTYDDGLLITFSNPHRFEIVVTELAVEIGTSSSACGASLAALPANVFTRGDLPEGGVLVPQRTGNTYGASSIGLDFEVSNDLPDACQDTTFELTYTGSAIRANQS